MITHTFICSACCGGSRADDPCKRCLFYQRPKLERKSNKLLIEETIGTGLATLLAKNLRLIDNNLPEESKRHKSDTEAIPMIKNMVGENKINVNPKTDGSFEFRSKNAVIILTP